MSIGIRSTTAKWGTALATFRGIAFEIEENGMAVDGNVHTGGAILVDDTGKNYSVADVREAKDRLGEANF